MRKLFAWYFSPTKDETDSVWRDGVLTVDTNVLLDLYRFHDETREQLLKSLEAFKGRTWLAYQVADEFIANRTRVIASTAKTFRDATETLNGIGKSLASTVDTLRGYRIVPRTLIEELNRSSSKAVEAATEALKGAETAHPDYLQSDPILERILALFADRVGPAPEKTRMEELHREGEERVRAQVPPGYLDKQKDGMRPYGDFILWRQVLEHAKEEGRPMILVTSERKEDWWETHSGKRIGPRQELLREAHLAAAQRILIHQTEHFVQLSASRQGQEVKKDIFDEIRDIGHRRETPHEPAVTTTQLSDAGNRFVQKGQLVLRVTRPVFYVTGTGRLEPTMPEVPDVTAELVLKPDGAPQLRVGAGTGTDFNFNVHLKSVIQGEPLVPGVYVVSYVATSGSQGAIEDPGVADPEAPEAGWTGGRDPDWPLRVYEVARQWSIPPRELTLLFQMHGVGSVQNHLSRVSDDEVEALRQHLERDGQLPNKPLQRTKAPQ